MAAAKYGTRQLAVNKNSPALQKAKVGDVLAELIAQTNAQTVTINALLVKLDAAGATVTGLGTNYNSTLAVPATALVDLENRK